MKPRRPGHATVVAYAALFVALGGTAWAALHIGSKQVTNNSLRSADLRNGKAVGGKDVIPNSLGGRQIDEGELKARGLVDLNGNQREAECPIPQSTEVTCAETRLDTVRQTKIFAIATGTEYNETTPRSGADCRIEFDGNASTFGSFSNPGDTTLNSSPSETNGFAMTGVSEGRINAGKHVITLVCSTGTAGTVIHTASIAAIALGEG